MNQKFWRMWKTEQFWGTIDFHSIFFPTMEVNGAPKQPGYKLSSKYLPLCSAEQRHSYRFGTTQGWVNDDRIFIFGWTIPLITASIRRGMEVISLWHCWGGMEAQVSLTVAFRSSAFLCLVSLIFLLTIPHRFSLGFRSGEFAGQSSTVTPWSLNQLFVPLAVWAGAKSCWKIKSASP